MDFYMTDLDEKKILAADLFNGSKFLYSENTIPAHREYREFNLLPRFRTRNNLVIICPESELENIVYKTSDEDNLFYIDPVESHVIEFLRSGLHPMGILVSGYIRYQDKFRVSESENRSRIIEKDKKPGELYNTLSDWIEKHFPRLDTGEYIGRDALECHREGISLSK